MAEKKKFWFRYNLRAGRLEITDRPIGDIGEWDPIDLSRYGDDEATIREILFRHRPTVHHVRVAAEA